MDKAIRNQIVGAFAKFNIDETKFSFLKIKDGAFKMCYANKFITYINAPDVAIQGNSQIKQWSSMRADLLAYSRMIIEGGSVFDVVCIVDIVDNLDLLQKTLESLKAQTKLPYIILIVSKHEEKQIAINHNIDHYWTTDRSSYGRICSAANYVRSSIREVQNLLICNSNDIYPDGWVRECHGLIKKKNYDMVGTDNFYISEKGVAYSVEIDQQYGKNIIDNTNWIDICFYNGMLINKNILNRIDWNIMSPAFNNNSSFGIHDRLIKSVPKVCYLKTRNIMAIYTDSSINSIRDLKSNKCYKVVPIEEIPYIDSSVIRQLTLPIKKNIKIKIVGIKPDGSGEQEEQIKEPVLIEEPKRSYNVPMIFIKKKEDIEEPKPKIGKYIAPAQRKPIIEEIIPEKVDITELVDKKQKQTSLPKQKTKLVATKQILKNPNKLLTLIINRSGQIQLDQCLKYLKAQLNQTDTIVVTSHKGIYQTLISMKELAILTNNNGNDKLDIIEGLLYARNYNPMFLCIVYDYDLVAPDWTRECIANIKRNDYDVVGKNNAYVYDKVKNELFIKSVKSSALTHMPEQFRKKWTCFNGKMIYNRILHKTDWNIFSNNMDMELDISLMMKLIDKGAKFGQMKGSYIVSIPVDDNMKKSFIKTYVELDNVKIADYLPIDDIKKMVTAYPELLGQYKINFTRPERKLTYRYVPTSPIFTGTEIAEEPEINVYNINNSQIELNDEDDIDRPMLDSNRIVQGLWIGDELSTIEQLCILSFIKNGHEFHLYTYNKKMRNIPDECVVKDGNEILPESEIFYYSEEQSLSGKRSVAAFSNMFRYKMLYDKGGYWVDMDMVCLKPFNFRDPYVFSSEKGSSGFQVINAGVMKCPQGAEFSYWCYSICKSKDKSKLKWGEIGPSLVRDGINRCNLSKFVRPWYAFCPIGFEDINSILDPNSVQPDQTWYGIHLWNEIWRKNGIEKNRISYSFITQLLYKENIEPTFNKAGVLITWLPLDQFVEKHNEKHEKRVFSLNESANHYLLDQFIDNDIYIDIMRKLKEYHIINKIHIIFATKGDNTDSYNNKFTMFKGNYVNYRDYSFWRVYNLTDLNFVKDATIVFNRGRYEKMYNKCNFDPSKIFIMNYPATALNQMVVGNKVLDLVDDKQRTTFPYDILFTDEDKHDIYQKMYPRAKNILEFYKLGYGPLENYGERKYDIIYCGSPLYPTKNAILFLDYLNYLDDNEQQIRICIVSKFNDPFPKYKNLCVEEHYNVGPTRMKELFSLSRNNLIFSGRDANPRIISESLSCGCYCICLNTLSDGWSVFDKRPELGCVVNGREIYLDQNQSACCKPSTSMFRELTNKILAVQDHIKIAEVFDRYITRSYEHEICRIVDLYKKSNKGVYIMTLATEDYTKPMNYLLSSIKYTNPSLTVVAICVNCKESLLRSFSTHYPNYKFINHQIKDGYTKGDILKLKVKMQRYFFNKYEKPFLWIDADTIVTRSLNLLLYNMMDNNLTVYTRLNNEEEYMKFAVGVIGYGYGNDPQITKDLLDKYYEETLKTKGLNNWFHDQIALWELYQKDKKLWKVYQLRDRDHSLDCNPDSIIVSRRRHKETDMKKILDNMRCPVAEIDFTNVLTIHNY